MQNFWVYFGVQWQRFSGLLMGIVGDEHQIWGPAFRQGSLHPVDRGKPVRSADRGGSSPWIAALFSSLHSSPQTWAESFVVSLASCLGTAMGIQPIHVLYGIVIQETLVLRL